MTLKDINQLEKAVATVKFVDRALVANWLRCNGLDCDSSDVSRAIEELGRTWAVFPTDSPDVFESILNFVSEVDSSLTSGR